MKDEKKRNKNTKKSLQSDDLPSLQPGAEFKLRTPKLRIQKKKKKELKKNISKSTTLSFFFVFISYIQLDSDINSSTRSIYFYNHFKVPLIFF